MTTEGESSPTTDMPGVCEEREPPQAEAPVGTTEPPQAAAPASTTSTAEKTPQPPTSPNKSKPWRHFGSTLGSSWGASSLPKGDTSMSINFDVTKKISKKYAGSVKEADLRHTLDLMPIDKLSPIHPDAQNMTRGIKQDLDAALIAAEKSGDEGTLKVMMDQDDFKRRLHFLESHTKTGEQMVEHYGTQGVYEGDFMYGMRHGRGKHEFQGESYEGEWKWDQRHGKGDLTLPGGSKIKGSWQNGKPHGYISMYDKSGSVIYEGEFLNGKRHGLGRQKFESGDMYDGGWADGRLHGRGVYYFVNNDKLYGMWNKGQYDGIGVFHYADGSVSRRVYKDGLLQSVQDWEQSTKRFGRTVNRDHMHKHTYDKDFPKDVLMIGP